MPTHPHDPFTVLQLGADVHAIGRALLDGDLTEARFRTEAVTTTAQAFDFGLLAQAAEALTVVLHPPHTPPGHGVGDAYSALCLAIEALEGPGRLG